MSKFFVIRQKSLQKVLINKAANESAKTSEFVIVKNVNVNLENRIVHLEKLQAKAEQYNIRNNVEISGISNEISDEDLENNVLETCKNSNIINPADIKCCRHLPLERDSTTDCQACKQETL